MNRKTYLTILTIITVVCIIAGSVYHIIDWGLSFAGHLFPYLNHRSPSISWSEDLRQASESDETSDSFSAISVDAYVMGLEIIPGKRTSLSFEGSSELAPKYEVKDGVLVITQSKPKQTAGNKKCKVTLTVPSDVTFTSIDVRSNVGDIDISGIKGKKLSLSANVGDIDMEDCEFEDIAIDADVGDIDADDCAFLRLTIDASVGDVDVDGTPDLSDYTISLGTKVGEVHFDGKNHKRNYSQAGDSNRYINISNSTGDISVKE